MTVRYVVSLPERALRAIAAALGGVIYEVTQVLLPGWLRTSRLYQAVIATMLRIVIELIGGVRGILPPDDVDVGTLAARKVAGNVIEVASFLTIGWSPLWLLAAVADLTGGTRTYLQVLVSELEREGILPEETDIASAEELLNTLEATSGLMAETIDVPPLNVDEMRTSWQTLRQNVADLPDARRLADLYSQLEQAAKREGRSLRSVSSLIAAGAARASGQIGHTYIFDYYRDALGSIASEGLPTYARRVSRPYLSTAMAHLDPKRTSHTERLLSRLSREGDTIENGAR
jgi:hypothetical protein